MEDCRLVPTAIGTSSRLRNSCLSLQGEEHNSSRFVFRENHTHAPQYGEEVRGEKQDGKQSREREREEKGKEGGRVERRGGGGEWQMNL